MRIVFMGTPEFSVGTLEALLAAGHQVVAVVTQPDRMKGRGKTVQFPPVKEAALAHKLPVYQPEKVRDPEFIRILRDLSAEIIVVVAFGQILPKEILELYPYGCVNVHASLLPAYRGAAPYQWAVINGETVTGVTTMQMNEGLDTGDILEKIEVAISPEETAGSLHDKLSCAGAALCVQTLQALAEGTVVPVPQKEEDSSYAKMLKKDMGKIDWGKSAEEIERLIRGLNPWPSAYTRLGGKTLKIWKAAVLEGEPEDVLPGSFVFFDKKNWVIQTGHGRLSLLEVQLEGKKRMGVEEFLRGYAMEKEENKCFCME
jgi:methionyl-tRNA formyltransferase